MARMQVKAHSIKNTPLDNWHKDVEGRWTWDQLRADRHYLDWLSFCSLVWDRQSDLLYCGAASLTNDIFWTFDRSSGRFTSLDFAAFGDRFDAKLHRSLEQDADGTFYAATALLHDLDHLMEAAGGKLFSWHPQTRQYTLLDIPVPHHYIQSIVLDRRRRVIYGVTLPAEILFCHDLATSQTRHLAYVGAAHVLGQAHVMAVDSNGRLWGTWAEIRAWEDVPGPNCIRLLCYDPAADQTTWFDHGLPKVVPGDRAAVDTMLLADDGLIYIGTTAGGLCCLDPATGDATLLGKPASGRRLTGLALGRDGRLYGVGGDCERARVFAYDRETGRFDHFGGVFDPELGEGPERVHHMAMTDDYVVFAGENDNPRRSGFLWECRLTR
jgi:hypothetical protein